LPAAEGEDDEGGGLVDELEESDNRLTVDTDKAWDAITAAKGRAVVFTAT